ncbi:MAG TPA: dihydroorotate dehydrogenase-like protein [Anaerolineales bacterium]|jgi:dihydroorotate dehydrogenase (fumarate)|nr:dihydroorotate dehydrogenase-like protein [Anaerolineales bacterium]
MPDMRTTYLGLPLSSPIIVAASSISSMIDRIRLAERSGAGALVIRSLFEEQILVEALHMEEALAPSADFAEATSFFPTMKHAGAREHLLWIEKTRAEVRLPLIASLNAVTPGGWREYARQLADTGIDALEINVYSVAADSARSGSEVEAELYNILETVKGQVSIPVAVKLSPYYSSMAFVAGQLAQRGAAGLVLFNRFLQPDIDPHTDSLSAEMTYSRPEEMLLPLRWVALLHGRVPIELALNTGVHSGLDVAKALLAGAQVVQVASALLQHGIPYLSTMLRELEIWMDERGYQSVGDFRGKLSQAQVDDPLAFERAQYVKLLMAQQ